MSSIFQVVERVEIMVVHRVVREPMVIDQLRIQLVEIEVAVVVLMEIMEVVVEDVETEINYGNGTCLKRYSEKSFTSNIHLCKVFVRSICFCCSLLYYSLIYHSEPIYIPMSPLAIFIVVETIRFSLTV